MKKVALAVITVLITTLSVIGQDFRKTTWGMSPSEVKASEDSKLVKETLELLVYETTLAGYYTHLGYVFADVN